MKVCSKCESSVRWIGCSPYGEAYLCAGGCLGRVTVINLEDDYPGLSVTKQYCVVCGEDISDKRAGAKTCSARCRKAASRS